jgi:excisionase family DNA binding protein
MIKTKEFFTTAQLAEKLKMNVQVITRKVQAGEIQAYKIGKDWRIPEEAVTEWLERQSNRKTEIPHPQRVEATPQEQAQSEPLPTQRSKRKHVLEYILAQFEPHRLYTEEEVNRVISRHHQDYATVRQEFLSEKMMERVDSHYRRRNGYKVAE